MALTFCQRKFYPYLNDIYLLWYRTGDNYKESSNYNDIIPYRIALVSFFVICSWIPYFINSIKEIIRIHGNQFYLYVNLLLCIRLLYLRWIPQFFVKKVLCVLLILILFLGAKTTLSCSVHVRQKMYFVPEIMIISWLKFFVILYLNLLSYTFCFTININCSYSFSLNTTYSDIRSSRKTHIIMYYMYAKFKIELLSFW